MNLTLGYLRVSTDRQDLSLEAQTEALRRAAAYYNGGAPPDPDALSLFAESDTSGSTAFAERPEGKALLERARDAIAAGLTVTVLVPKLDRLGRNTDDVRKTVQAIEQMGDPGDRSRIIFLDLNVDSRTAIGRLIITVVAACAELELARIRERIQTCLDQKRANGHVTGTVTYGWDGVETGETTAKGVKIRKLVPNATEQGWLRHMLDMRAAGASDRHIARALNQAGVPTKQRCKSGWSSAQVHKLLSSRTVKEMKNVE